MTALQRLEGSRKFRLEQSSTDLIVWKNHIEGSATELWQDRQGLSQKYKDRTDSKNEAY